jgi:hypothetical protein
MLVEQCFRRKRARGQAGEGGVEGHYAQLARFLGVEPITLRRWRTGERPIPRQVEIIMETFNAYPQVTADAINNVIHVRDEEASKA